VNILDQIESRIAELERRVASYYDDMLELRTLQDAKHALANPRLKRDSQTALVKQAVNNGLTTTKQIHHAHPGIHRSIVCNVLRNMVCAGELVRVKHGVYRKLDSATEAGGKI